MGMVVTQSWKRTFDDQGTSTVCDTMDAQDCENLMKL
jgi:hypothetical protein